MTQTKARSVRVDTPALALLQHNTKEREYKAVGEARTIPSSGTSR